MNASSALDRAKLIITGERVNTHGKQERSFETISVLWSAYVTARLGYEVRLTEADVCRMMAALKIARAAHGSDPDHDLDLIGYGALAVEMETEE